MAAKFRFGGQVCIAPNRFLVHEQIHDEFVEKMAVRIRALRVGDGLDTRTDLGPLINLRAKEKVRADGWGVRGYCDANPSKDWERSGQWSIIFDNYLSHSLLRVATS